MPQKQPSSETLKCTAFDNATKIASGSYLHVALAVKVHLSSHGNASVLIFDDATGKQMDFDLRGSRDDISLRLSKQFPGSNAVQLLPGRPKLGVVAKEVTLLPRHWDWLGEQPGGASVTLRKLVEEAQRTALTDKARLRKLHERAYSFMSAIAGNLPDFEEASRALFANNIAGLKQLIAKWPPDIREHLERLYTDVTSLPNAKPKK
ncbi:MAG: DUF2239 family protein [Hyphomicrobium sp.]